MFGELRPELRHLVHKEHDDDVLLANPRAALPSRFECAVEDFDALVEDERVRLTRYWVLGKSRSEGRFSFRCAGFPETLSSQQHDGLCADASDAELIRRNYRATDDGQHVLLDQRVAELEQDQLTTLFGARVPSELEKFKLSCILDKLQGIELDRVYRATMLNHGNHYFFYRKSHDHVPGIMIMELARQAFYAQFYRFSGHSKGSVALSILEFNVLFHNYIDSNYPVHVQVEDGADQIVTESREIRVKKAKFIQKDAVVTEVEMKASAVKSRIFERLRNVRPDPNHLFFPLNATSDIRAVLIDPCGLHIEARLRGIGYREVTMSSAQTTARMPNGTPADIYLFVPAYGVLRGRGLMDGDSAPGDGTDDLRLAGVEWSASSEKKLREFIKTDCHVLEHTMILVREPQEAITAVGLD